MLSGINRDFLDAYEIAAEGDSEALAKRMFDLEAAYPNKGFKEAAIRILKRASKNADNNVLPISDGHKCAVNGCGRKGTMGKTVRAVTGKTKWYCSEHWS